MLKLWADVTMAPPVVQLAAVGFLVLAAYGAGTLAGEVRRWWRITPH